MGRYWRRRGCSQKCRDVNYAPFIPTSQMCGQAGAHMEVPACARRQVCLGVCAGCCRDQCVWFSRTLRFAPQRVIIRSSYTGIHDQRERSQVQCLHVCLKPSLLDLLWSYERNATWLLATRSLRNQGCVNLTYIVLISTAVFRSFLDGPVSHGKAKQHLQRRR